MQAEESLGYIHEQQQDYQKALETFKSLEAKVSESKKPAILLAIGRNYESLEQPEEAISIYQQVIDSNTSFSLKNTAKERLDILQAALTTAPQEDTAATTSEEPPAQEQPASEEASQEEAQPTAPEQESEEQPASEEGSGEADQQTESAEQPAEQPDQAEESTEETNQ